MVYGFGFRVLGLWFMVLGLGFWVSGFGLRSGLGFGGCLSEALLISLTPRVE